MDYEVKRNLSCSTGSSESIGTRDSKYLNRNRLAHYILYTQIDDEDTIQFLFEEGLQDVNDSVDTNKMVQRR